MTQTTETISLVIKLAYNGAAYHGFMRQSTPPLVTVQGKLEDALAIVFGRPVKTVCAGRTDAGVHALGQVVSAAFAYDELFGRQTSRLLTSLNACTPHDISISRLGYANPDFSARFDACKREYRYRICLGAPPQFLRSLSWWHRGALDVDAMREGAKCLVGEHDFKSFCKAASAEGKNTVRKIELLELFEEQQLGERCLVVRIVGNAFLHSMVRVIVGTLVCVGVGKRKPSWVGEALEARERCAAGQTAPACGLTLWHVTYPHGAIRDELSF